MLRRILPVIRCANQARSASAICSKLPPQIIAPALTRTKMDSKQGPQAVTGHLDMYGMGLDRKTPTGAEVQAELYEVLCNFKDYKVDRDSVCSSVDQCLFTFSDVKTILLALTLDE